MKDSTYEGCTNLFPVQIHKFKLEAHLINQALIGLEHDTHLNYDDNFVYKEVFNHPDFSDLQAEVLINVKEVCPHTTRTNEWKTVSAWLNNQPPQQSGFGFHNHADAFLSAVLYLKGSQMSLKFRDDAKEAQGTNSVEKDFDLIIRHTWNKDQKIDVAVGDLLVFPSYLLHCPNHNETNEDRISIAYNLMPTRFNGPQSSPWSMDFRL